MEKFVVAGTGSRSLATAPIAHWNLVMQWVHRILTATIDNHPNEEIVVMSGGAEGFDHLVAEAAIQMGLPLWLVLPSPDYSTYYWRDHSVLGVNRIEIFAQMFAEAHYIDYVCDDHYGFSGRAGSANFDRNQFMVDHADGFLVYSPTSRGTRDCVKRIDAVNKPKRVFNNR